MPGKYSASPKKTAKGWLSWIFSSLLAICGICIASLAIWLYLEFADEAPILLSPPEEATQQVTDLMDAVCRGIMKQQAMQSWAALTWASTGILLTHWVSFFGRNWWKVWIIPWRAAAIPRKTALPRM